MSAQPIQIVRTLKKGELTPTYSTAELLSGVRHFVVIPEAHANKETRRIAQEKMLGAARGVETQKKRAGERFRSRLPVIKEMLAQGSTNKDIAARFGVCEALIKRYIAKSPELKALSLERTEMRKGSRKLELIRGKIETMHAAGIKSAAIARALGMHRGNLWKYQKMMKGENKNAQG